MLLRADSATYVVLVFLKLHIYLSGKKKLNLFFMCFMILADY